MLPVLSHHLHHKPKKWLQEDFFPFSEGLYWVIPACNFMENCCCLLWRYPERSLFSGSGVLFSHHSLLNIVELKWVKSSHTNPCSVLVLFLDHAHRHEPMKTRAMAVLSVSAAPIISNLVRKEFTYFSFSHYDHKWDLQPSYDDKIWIQITKWGYLYGASGQKWMQRSWHYNMQTPLNISASFYSI